MILHLLDNNKHLVLDVFLMQLLLRYLKKAVTGQTGLLGISCK